MASFGEQVGDLFLQFKEISRIPRSLYDVGETFTNIDNLIISAKVSAVRLTDAVHWLRHIKSLGGDGFGSKTQAPYLRAILLTPIRVIDPST